MDIQNKKHLKPLGKRLDRQHIQEKIKQKLLNLKYVVSTYKALIVRKVLRRTGPKFWEPIQYSFRNKVQRNVEELKNV